MTVFRKTILGKILTGAAKVALPVVGAVVGVGAIGGIIKGVGALHGVGGILAGGKKVIDKVAVSAVNLVTGTTQPERIQVREQKKETQSIVDAWDQVKRLVRAGATEAEAEATVGVTRPDAPTVEVSSQGVTIKTDVKKYLMYAGLGLAALFLLPKILKGK